MKGDVKRNTSPSGDNPDTTDVVRAASPVFGLYEPMLPAVEELQCIIDIARNLISKMGRLRPTTDLSEPRGLTLYRVMRGGI